MGDLPYDLWAHIATHAYRTDLPSLVLVSSVHLHATRPVLFRHLRLRMPKHHPNHNIIYLKHGQAEEDLAKQSALEEDRLDVLFELLRADGGALARIVDRLDLEDAGRYTRETSSSLIGCVYKSRPIIPLDVLACMSNLRSLRISNCWPFHPNTYQLNFVNVINENCPFLSQVNFLGSKNTTPETLLALGTPLAIKGVKRVNLWSAKDCFDEHPFSFMPLQSLLVSSASTLTHIILPSPIDDTTHAPKFTETHFFPVLDTFVLGIWLDCGRQGIPSEHRASLAKFIYKHPTIRTVSLGWSPPAQYRTMHFEALLWEAKMFADMDRENFLPNLSSLEAHEVVTIFLARNAPSCLHNLIELRTGIFFRSTNEPSRLFRLLAEEIGGISTLKRLMYSHGHEKLTDLDKFGTFMDETTTAFPALESWEGDLPSGTEVVTHNFIGDMFSKFPNLQHLQIASWGNLPRSPSSSPSGMGYESAPPGLPEPDISKLLEIARAVAERCLNFKLLVSTPVYNADSKSSRTKVVVIKRDKDGGPFETMFVVHEEQWVKDEWWRRRRICVDEDMNVYSEYDF